MKKVRLYLFLGITGLFLFGCRDAGKEVAGKTQADTQANAESTQIESEQETENLIKLTEEQLNETHIDMQINDKIRLSAYITPYDSYKDGVNIYQAISNKDVFVNDYENIVKEISLQTNKNFNLDYINESGNIYCYTSDDDMMINCSGNGFGYTDKEDTGEITYFGFGVSHKNEACQGILKDKLCYADKIKNIETLTKMNYFDRVEIYNYDTLTADSHIYENYLAKSEDAGLKLLIEDDGYEYAVLYSVIDNLPYKYQGVIYKKVPYDTYNEKLFTQNPYFNSSITAVSTELVNNLRVCYDGEKLTNLAAENNSITGEKLSVEKVIDANQALQIVLKKLGNADGAVIITSIELCYDVKLYIHDGMLDGKYYPYWIVNYYDYSKEFSETNTVVEDPAGKYIIDAVNGTVIERTRWKPEVEE